MKHKIKKVIGVHGRARDQLKVIGTASFGCGHAQLAKGPADLAELGAMCSGDIDICSWVPVPVRLGRTQLRQYCFYASSETRNQIRTPKTVLRQHLLVNFVCFDVLSIFLVQNFPPVRWVNGFWWLWPVLGPKQGK
jgi:hypothetical protein